MSNFTKDHDIKIVKTFYDTDSLGVTTTVIGSIDLISANVGIESATIKTGFNTTTIAEFNKDRI